MESKEQAILKVAEEMVRSGGYNGFSFREIAQQVGIKSSSVHYYFPTKEDLGVAVVQYYADKFIDFLGSPEELMQRGDDPIERYVAAFKHALTEDKGMCLCGVFGAEVNGLPDKVAAETKNAFVCIAQWLEQAYIQKGMQEHSKTNAIQVLALLQGAMIASKVMNDISVFDQATKHLLV